MAFISTLPPSASAMERALEQVFWEEIQLIERDIQNFLDPWKCRLDLLPYLAWELSVDDWNETWDEQTKRKVVSSSLEIHTYKGTRYAIDKSIEAIRADSLNVIEWFDDPATLAPAEFRVELVSKQSPVDAATIPQISSAIRNAKNTRSHLTKIRITSHINTPEKLATVSRQGIRVGSGPWAIRSVASVVNRSACCFSRLGVVVRSGPLPR
ncbi:phage tail protein I [Photobacterium galatheae]|uniref:phage tail protein I n=1 Tax=Photobacterium galatheae TaxID=1654360 RepID=UPI000569E1A8|nr:phage tail protein I [Photobacterium galatheae]MCM0151656.1 phage tail protein I [Photobacterium galatheae]